MAIPMQGAWTVRVKSKSAAFPQRFIIAGADSGNGTYAGDVTTPPVFVTGPTGAFRFKIIPAAVSLIRQSRSNFQQLSAPSTNSTLRVMMRDPIRISMT